MIDEHPNLEAEQETNEAAHGGDRLEYADHRDFALVTSSRQNLVQAMVVLLFMVVGAGVGYFTVDDRPDLAAIAGAVVGMSLGTFLSGSILMLWPSPRIKLTGLQIQRKYAASRRRLWMSGVAGIFMLICLPMVIGIFGHDSSDLAWLICLGWPLVTVGLCVYAKSVAHRLKEWRCPRCNAPLGVVGTACPQCGFLMSASTASEKQSD